MNPLKRAIDATQGFCELKMWNEAWEELETLPPGARANPSVLNTRVHILMCMERWGDALELVEGMLARGATDPALLVIGSKAARMVKDFAKAKALLLRGESELSGTGTFHYRLACAECQLGDLDAAKRRLERAFALDAELRAPSHEEPDLALLWALLSDATSE
jgi:predicted Zn-dependent protease